MPKHLKISFALSAVTDLEDVLEFYSALPVIINKALEKAGETIPVKEVVINLPGLPARKEIMRS